MKSKLRRLFSHSIIGTLTGVGLLIIFVLALVYFRGHPYRDILDKIFAVINRPIEMIPWAWAEELAERQDPVLSLGIVLAYWGILGMLGGIMVFLLKTFTGARGKMGSNQ